MLPSVSVRRLLQRSGLAALLQLLVSVVVVAAATLTLFTAAYDGANVRVEWELSTETDVTGFELSRKAASDINYTTVSTIVPTGQRRYQYLDTNVYRTTAGGGPFTYRLTVRGPGGDQSYLTVLADTPSAVQRSWGTIKSMFR